MFCIVSKIVFRLSSIVKSPKDNHSSLIYGFLSVNCHNLGGKYLCVPLFLGSLLKLGVEINASVTRQTEKTQRIAT